MGNINAFLNNGIKDIGDTMGRFYLGSRKGLAFLTGMASALSKSAKRRDAWEEETGVHIPPFLIASITTSCNLHCAGCYARANGGCGERPVNAELSAADWQRVFQEAEALGVSFILLAGGEPLLRREVVALAADFPTMLFPVFTNGTLLDAEYFALFERYRNIIPVMSIEGDEGKTDARRGAGVAEQIAACAKRFQAAGVLYGVSITVTNKNSLAVTQSSFIQGLRAQGCGLVFFVEYVPAEANTQSLALDGDGMRQLQARVELLRQDKGKEGMILLSFPGDEELMGGCLAAGRGFFHINAGGGAEPCPFSPYSELNVKEQSLMAVLGSPFFASVREISAAQASEHTGGCTLFQHAGEVKAKMAASPQALNPKH